MSVSADSSLPAGTVIGGKYQIERRLGEGGMGTVYAATRDDGTRWALKTLTGAFSTDATVLRRFFREARLSGDIRSEHVAPVIECGTDPATNIAYLIMPLLIGEDLAALVERLGPLEPSLALRIGLQAAQGLHAAHELGILHRDVKPSNLFLHREGDSVVVKVCDFGIGKLLSSDEQLTASGSVLGSPLYMAPEQFTNAKRADYRADVWGLAVSLYEALSGAAPFASLASFANVVMAVTSRDAPPLQDSAPWVPATVAEVVHSALLRDVKARCPSMEALREALRAGVGPDGAIRLGDLRGVPAEQRSLVAPRAQKLDSWLALAMTGAMELPHDPLFGKVLGGRYTMQRLLGRGGMGAVYEAADRDGTPVAVKVVLEERSKKNGDAVRRFLREARSAVAVRHENVVRVLDADTDAESGAPFIVMELLRGTDLATLLRRHGALAPRPLCRLFVEACRGVSAAHELSIVHRDLKPANIFLHENEDGSCSVKICDFGVAKRVLAGESDGTGTDLTLTGGMVGSPVYMSPEQARNAKQVDRRSDVWSLGVTLHEALTGERPWGDEGSSVGELILAICTRDVASVQDRAPWVSAGLAEAVHRALRREPDERYDSAAQLAEALEPFASPVAEPLTVDALTSLSEAERRSAAPRSSAVGAGSIAGGVSTATAPASRKGPPWVALGLAVAVLGIGGLIALRGTPSAGAGPVAAAQPAPAAASRRHVRVPVTPADAVVSVGGQQRNLDQGVLELDGEAGETFAVTVEASGRKLETTLVLRLDGTTQPAALTLPPAPSVTPVAASSASAATPPGTPTNRAARSTKPGVAVAATPAVPAVAAPAAPRPTATGLQPSTDWR